MRTLLLAVSLVGCQRSAPPPSPTPAPAPAEVQPEQATGCRNDIEPVRSEGAIVAAAHPEAARIGADVLARGGSAADAAAAIAVALTLVEPQSSGIGGGAFVLHHDAETGTLSAWDGREAAPAAATGELFQGADGRLGWTDVVPTGLSVGTPGLLRLLEDLHAEHGSLPWSALFAPTIALAEEGFTVTPRMSASVARSQAGPSRLGRNDAARAYFFPGGAPVPAGATLRNPALASTLRTIAEGGADAFYEGPIAERIVAAVAATDPPGRLTVEDLARYEAVRRDPVCLDYRGRRVCGHPPPSSGGVTVLQILGHLERFDLAGLDPAGPELAHLFTEATRLAWADRDRYLADPDAVAVPTQALLDEGYLAARSALIAPTSRLAEVAPGEVALPAGPEGTACPEGADTTHFVVVDAAGDVVSMTSSIETAFGSGILVDGFLLNNQLTDFSFEAVDAEGRPIANRPGACKRPRSSMAPTIVYGADGAVELAVGSPGGSRIIQYVARSLVNVLDQGDTLQAAVSRPHLVGGEGGIELERGCGTPPWPDGTATALEALGHEVRWSSLNSGLHGVQRVEGGWTSAVDPRREGEARAVP